MANNQRRHKNYGWVISMLALGLIGSGAAYFAFVANMTDVVVATQTIPANTEIKQSMLAVKKVDKSALPDNYVPASQAKNFVGLYTNVGITKGSIWSSANVATKDTKKSAVIPEGKTLLSIEVTNLPQGIASGDNVNLLIGISSGTSKDSGGRIVVTYQNIKVTNTYLNDNGEVTGLEVQVTPEQAQKIQYAQLNGELSVSLLPPGYKNEDLSPVDSSSAEDYSGDGGYRTSSKSSSSSSSSSGDEKVSIGQ